MIGWLIAAAIAADAPSCEGVTWPEPQAHLSVAWVSPVGRTVGRNGEVWVVPTSELQGWVSREGGGSVARMLQRLGLRRRGAEPSRKWKVVVFDVQPADLCRPVGGYDHPVALAGVATCAARHGKPSKVTAGCGYTADRQSGEMGLELYRARWSDLARDGFCVLPAERFVQARSGSGG